MCNAQAPVCVTDIPGPKKLSLIEKHKSQLHSDKIIASIAQVQNPSCVLSHLILKSLGNHKFISIIKWEN